MIFKSLMAHGPKLCGMENVYAERVGRAGILMFDDEYCDKNSVFRRQDIDKTDIEMRFMPYFVMLDHGVSLGADPKKVQGLKRMLMSGGAKTPEQKKEVREDSRYSQDKIETVVFAETVGAKPGDELNVVETSFWDS